MALLKCPECRKKFSDKAVACPSCGAPTALAVAANKKGWKNALIGFAIIIGFFVAVGASKKDEPDTKQPPSPEEMKRTAEINEIKRQRMAREFVLANLKDPGSAKFRNQRDFCGEVNSKNSFGGYTGFRRFIAAGEALVFLEGDPGLARGAFQEAWNKTCR